MRLNALKPKAKLASRFDREAWLRAGLEVLARQGQAKLRVSTLALKLGVTKGSFYHHFKSRDEFVQCLFSYWSSAFTDKVIAELNALEGPPEWCLLQLMRIIEREKLDRYDIVFRSWAAQDTSVAKFVKKVDLARYRFIRSLFAKIGFEGDDLEDRVRLWLVFQSAQNTIYVPKRSKHGSRSMSMVASGQSSSPSLVGLLAFESVLADLTSQLANVGVNQFISEIENALRRLLKFLGFDRSAFWEFVDEKNQHFLCSAAVEGLEPPSLGPIPAELSWISRELREGRTVALRSDKDNPPEAAAAVEYNRRAGISSVLVIPLLVGGRVVAAIGFGAVGSPREWPAEFLVRVTVIGEVMAEALVRTRSDAAHRASEARWQSIFETSHIGVAEFDQELRYITTNPAFQTMLGYTDAELRQFTTLDVTLENDREAIRSRLADLQQGRVDHYVVEKRYRRKDGTILWGHSSITRAPDSIPERFIGTLIDITESKRTQHELQVMQAKLARLNSVSAAGQMTASIAHEIKQPLAAVATNSSAGLRWLARTPPDLDEVRTALTQISEDIHRVDEVIEGVRTMFRKVGREKRLLDINHVISEVLSLLRSELQNYQILVQTDLDPNLPPVLGDSVQLQQVLANLVRNAIEAMDTATGRARALRVKSAIREAEGVLIMVEDTGPGIDPENTDRIFDPFLTTKPQGMGMGLSICRSIIEAHDGRLSARSGVDQGAIFQIELPAGGNSYRGNHPNGPLLTKHLTM
jgi:PAS domain S-box-containing protein